MSLSREQLKEKFMRELGPSAWDDSWAGLLENNPEFFAASLNLSTVPKKKKHLAPKIQALVALTVDCASTHLYAPGIRHHMKAALEAGATKAEIMECLELSSTLGIHACNIGIPLLVQVMKEEGVYESHPTASKPFDQRRLALQDDFTKKRGYWHTFWEDFLALDPEFFEAYTEFSSVPWTKQVEGSSQKGGVLEPKVKELMYCAFDAAATHLYVSGLKEHMRNALKYGATAEEIMEVLEIATLLSIHTVNVSMPILTELTK